MKEFRLLNKITAIICLLLLTASCTEVIPSAADPIQPAVPEGVLHIPYCESDSVNPFFCEGEENAHLWPLAFLPLFEIDNSFTAVPVLAESVVQTGSQVIVTMRTDVKTPQGTDLTVADVLYSFRLAKESPAFKAQLSNFTSATVGAQADDIVFTLRLPNANACNLLHFPIVQYGTADGKDTLPIGAGPYTYKRTEDSIVLDYNPYYPDITVRSAQLRLMDATADTTRSFSLKSGRIDCSFSSLSDGNVQRLAATATTVPMTNLVFLGVNGYRSNLYSKIFRQALSLALDRQAIVEHAFCGYAQATSIPVHPQWGILQEDEFTNQTTAEVSAARKKLEEYESYTRDDDEDEEKEKEDIEASLEEDAYTLELVCCKDNAFKTGTAGRVAEQLKTLDIAVEVRALDEDDYYAAVRDGDYDLYLGEVRLSPDMNMSVFLLEGNSLGYGINNDAITCNAVWDSYCVGTATLHEFLGVFAQEMPFIPLCFREGIFYTSRSLVNEVICNPENLYANIVSWEKEKEN